MPRLLLLLAAGLLLALPTRAQQVAFGGDQRLSVQSLSFGYYLVDFSYDGAQPPPDFRFDFTNPAFGAVYTRPNLVVSFGVGTQRADDVVNTDLRLIDVALTTWGEFYPVAALAERATRVFIPIVLHTDYRRVSPRGSDSPIDDFNVTALGLGAGVGADHSFGDRVLLEGRAHPIIALASTSFTDALGNARILAADVQLHVGRLAGRFGLSLGYAFRGQVWNVKASDLFPDLTDEVFDYRGRQHVLRLGVNW